MIRIDIPETNHVLTDIIRAFAPFLDFENGPWIAGGALRRVVDGDIDGYYDIDIFMRDESQLPKIQTATNDIIERFGAGKGVASNVLRMIYYGKLKSHISVQVVKDFMFKSPFDLIDDFDFTICQFVSDGRYIWCPAKSLDDLAHKRLTLNPNSKVRNQSRVLKYCSRGFLPDDELTEKVKGNIGEYYHNEGKQFFDFQGYDDLPDLSEEMVLSKAIGCTLMNYDGKDLLFLEGIPFPLHLGYVWLANEGTRHDIDALLTKFWVNHNVNRDNLKIASKYPFDSFLDYYKSRITSTTLPLPRSSPTTASTVSTISSVKISSSGEFSSLTKVLTLIAIICSLIFATRVGSFY